VSRGSNFGQFASRFKDGKLAAARDSESPCRASQRPLKRSQNRIASICQVNSWTRHSPSFWMVSPVALKTVGPANRVDFGPVLANVHILKGDMIRPVGAEAWAAAAWMKRLMLHHEFRDAADGLSDPARFLRCELARADAVAP